MPKIRADQLESLRDALVGAYARLSDLRELADHGLGIDLDAEVDVGGGTRAVAWELIAWMRRHHDIDALFDAAYSRRPDHPALRAFAAQIGRASIRGAEQALRKSGFDLEDLESRCRDVLEGQLTRGLRVLLVAAEQDVFECLIERVRPIVHRSSDAPPPDTDVPLNPRLAKVDGAVQRIARLADMVARRHVLVKVHAAEASPPMLEGFFGGVRQCTARQLAHDLVMLVRAADDLGALPAGLVDLQLPPPIFSEAHLYRWVERVSDGQGWPEALKVDFKRALRALAGLDGELTPGAVYDAVNEAIECLRANPDETALRDWIALHLAA